MRGAFLKIYLINFFVFIVCSLSFSQKYITHEGEEWIEVADAATLDSMRSIHFPSYGKYLQTQDIDLSDYSGEKGWRPLGDPKPFTGVFDGQEHTISNLTINNDGTYQGLFGTIGPGGVLRHMRLTSVKITNTKNYVGALAGRNEGLIFDCAVLDGELSVNNYSGGLVGNNNRTGRIEQCYSGVNISGGTHLGGLVGINSNGGLIIDSYSDSKISGTSHIGGLIGSNANSRITNCYSSGQVTWSSGGGGLLGENTGVVKQSYWNIESSNQTNSSGNEEGKTDHEMKQAMTFIDWDFEEVWEIRNGESMPYLKSMGEIEIIKEIPDLTFVLNDFPLHEGSIINSIYGDVLTFVITSSSDGDLSDLIIESDDSSLLDLSLFPIIKVLKTGSTVLKITQPETDQYESKEVHYDIIINKKRLLVTPIGQQKSYGEEDPEGLQFTSVGLWHEDDQSVFSGELKRIEGENAGDYAIQLHSLSAGDHYAILLDTNVVYFKIIPREIIVNIDDQNKIYGNSDPELSFQIVGDTKIEIPFEGDLKREEGEDAGLYIISEGSLNAGSNYSLVFEERGNFIIHKAESEIVAEPIQSYTYDGTAKIILANLNHEETELAFESHQAFVNAGIYQVKISSSETTNYLATESTITLIINKAFQERLSLEDTSYVYNGEIRNLSVSGIPQGAEDGFDIVYENNGHSNTGTYKVTATISRPNFEDLVLSATLTIQKAASEIIAESIQSYIYDGISKTIIADLNHEEAELILEHQLFIKVGTYEVKISSPETTNYLATESTITLIINNAIQEGLFLIDTSYVYDGKIKELRVSGISKEIEQELEITYENNGHSNAGTYNVSVTVSRPNFEDLVLSANMTIHKAESEIFVEPIQIHTFDGMVKTISANLSHSEAILVFEPPQSYINAGAYQVKISSPETTNYLATESTITLIINKAVQKGLSLSDTSYVYNGEIRNLSVSGIPQGTEGDFDIAYENNGHSNAGTYTVSATISRLNFEDLVLSATLTIHKEESEIFAEPIQTHTYDGTAKTILANLNHEEADLAFEPYQAFLNAGTYQVKVSSPETTNYLATESTVTLTINKAIQKDLSLTDTSCVYNGEIRHLAVLGVPQGTEGDFVINYENNGHSNAGTYNVSATVSRSNFEDLVLSATLTIHKAESEIFVEPIQTHTFDGMVKTILANLNHSEAILVFEPQQSYINAGTYQVKISSPETTNYLATESIVTLIINKAVQKGLSLSDNSYVYNGEIRHLAVLGVPQGTEGDFDIAYENNGHSNAGTYIVTATISRPNFEDLVLSADLTIQKAASEIIADSIQSYIYDGISKTIIANLNHEEADLAFEPYQAFVNAGTYQVKISSPETTNYLATESTITLTINKAVQEGLSLSDTSYVYDGNIRELTVSGISKEIEHELKITYENNGHSNAGTYIVTATISRPNFKDLVLTSTLTIKKAESEIIAEPIQLHTYNGKVKAIVANLNHEEAELILEHQLFINVGTYEVKISSPETTNYLATESTITLIINNAIQEGLFLIDTSYVYDGKIRELTVSGISKEIEHELKITYENNGHSNAGTYKVSATVSRPNFEDLVLSAILTIRKAESEIIAEPIQNHTYNGTTKNVLASLNHEESELTFEPHQAFVNAGAYQVKISSPETTNYLATESTVTLTINKAIQKDLSLTDTSYVYNGEIRHLAVLGVPQGTEGDFVINYENNGQSNAGTYNVSATVSRPNFEDLVLSADLTIHKAESEIIAEPIQSYTYDGTAKNVLASLNHEEADLTFEPQQSFVDSGNYQIKITSPETTNYLAVESKVMLIINNSIHERLSLEDAHYIYNGEVRHLTVSGVPNDIQHDLKIIYENNGHQDAGTYNVTVTISRLNFEDLVLSANLTIHKAESKIFVEPIQTHTYDGMAKKIVAHLNHDEAILAFEAPQSFINASTYEVKISTPETTNYLATKSTITLIINKAIQEGLSLEDAHYVYNGEIRNLAVSGVPHDIQHDLKITYVHNGQVNAGTYIVIATISRPNFEDLVLSADLTIQKTESEIFAEPIQTHTYDGTAKTIIANLNHEETELTFEAFIQAGVYSLDIHSKETRNFLSGQAEITLIIEKVVLTITPDQATRRFGEQNPIFTMSYQGFKNNEDEGVLIKAPIGNTAASLTTGIGEYLIIPSGAMADNYDFEYIDGLLTITPANFEGISLKDATFNYNNQPYSLTVNNLPENASVSYENNNQINSGTYEVKATIHEFGFESQTLTALMTITKAPQTIHFKEVGSVSRNVHRIELDVVSSMGLPVQLSSDDDLVARLEEYSLLIHRLGNVRITAQQEGDANHEAATPVTIHVRVEDEAEGPVRVHQAISPNGDGINDFLILEGIKEFPQNRLKIISRTGLLVFDMEGYDNNTKVFKGISNVKTSGSVLPDGTYLYLLQYKNNGSWQSKKGWIVVKSN